MKDITNIIFAIVWLIFAVLYAFGRIEATPGNIAMLACITLSAYYVGKVDPR